MVRDKNDKAMDSKARHFVGWLERSGHDDVSLANMEEGQVIPTLVAYLHHIAFQQGSLKKLTTISPASLISYLNAAVEWLRSELGLTAQTASPSGARNKMIQDIIDQARNWQKPIEKREPYTTRMLRKLYDKVAKAAKTDKEHRLGKEAAVLDWARLSAFTGSRVGEYAQSVGSSSQASRVPDLPFAGEWAGTPIAFVAEDFTFYTKDSLRLSTIQLLSHPKSAAQLHIRFRYDKSPRNFVIRKFAISGHPILCPVRAAISVCCRALALGSKKGDPLGVARIPKNKRSDARTVFLTSNDVVRIMRRACLDAYPDPASYHHIHAHRIDAHSARVFAAMLLRNANVSIEDTAFRLRWQPESVEHYLRDCSGTIGTLTDAALKGSLVM